MRRMPDALVESDEARNLRVLLALVLVATISGGAVDLILDAPDRWLSAHVLFELSLILAAVGVMVALWRGWAGSHRTLVEAREALATRSAERDEWRASAESHLAGLGRAIDDRFTAWGLTPAEREVALMLLQGRSHKQIAFDTGRSERTVRQHSVVVYQKSGLQGRAELAAFFLGGLLLPSHPTSPSPTPP